MFFLAFSLFFSTSLQCHDETILYVLKQAQAKKQICPSNININDPGMTTKISTTINANKKNKQAMLAIQNYNAKTDQKTQKDTLLFEEALNQIISVVLNIIIDVENPDIFNETSSGFLVLLFGQE